MAKFQPGGTMPDRLDDFQKFRADLNEEILSCGHLGIKRFFALDHQAYEPGALGTKPRSSSAWSPAPFCAATIASPTIWSAAAKKAGSATKSSTPQRRPRRRRLHHHPHVRRAFARMREIDGLKNS